MTTSSARRPPPLVLTNPTSARTKCPACGKEVKDMCRHSGTAACSNAARRAMIDRLGLVEVWWREGNILKSGNVSVLVIRDQKKGKDTRRWYAPPESVEALRKLGDARFTDKAISRLLRGPKDELERELALLALRGDRHQEDVEIPSLFGAVSSGGAVRSR